MGPCNLGFHLELSTPSSLPLCAYIQGRFNWIERHHTERFKGHSKAD